MKKESERERERENNSKESERDRKILKRKEGGKVEELIKIIRKSKIER